MSQLFKNNATSYIDGAISAAVTSISLPSGAGAKFPVISGSDYFLATIVGLSSSGIEDTWEIVKVTARSSDTLTVVRAQESTTALSWAHASRIENRLTAATTNTFTLANYASVDDATALAISLG